MKAPNFVLPDQTGTRHTLANYLGKWVVLYFYPKDDTPGCTVEACSFRDNLEKLQELGVVVLGVSKDSVASHKKFADKFKLNFPLLSDPNCSVIKSYGAWGKKSFLGKSFDGILRKTFLIGPDGEIIKEYSKVKPIGHVNDILADISNLIMTRKTHTITPEQ